MSEPPDTDAPEAEPSDREVAEADELRRALEDPARGHEDAELARALAGAWAPRDLSVSEHAALVQRALARAGARPRRGRVVRISFGAGAVVALAASFLLVLRTERASPVKGSATAAAVATSRSTQPLFPVQFSTLGGETGRIDRIASARAADLRENQFAKWGVR